MILKNIIMNDQSRIKFHNSKNVDEVEGSEVFVKEIYNKEAISTLTTSGKEKDSFLLLTSKIYNHVTECKCFYIGVPLIIITIFSFLPVLEYFLPSIDDWIFELKTETLRDFFSVVIQSLIAVIAFQGAIIIGFFSIRGEEKVKHALWRDYIVWYLRYYAVVVAFSVVFYVFSDLIVFLGLEFFSVLLIALLVIISVFYLIKATEKAFDNFLKR